MNLLFSILIIASHLGFHEKTLTEKQEKGISELNTQALEPNSVIEATTCVVDYYRVDQQKLASFHEGPFGCTTVRVEWTGLCNTTKLINEVLPEMDAYNLSQGYMVYDIIGVVTCNTAYGSSYAVFSVLESPPGGVIPTDIGDPLAPMPIVLPN